jgi:alanine dehydrogenase
VRVGVPKEIKSEENRVGLVPAAVGEFVRHGHQVLVETGAALSIGYDDASYISAGAKIAGSARDVFDGSDMIVKVKEPQPSEIAMLRENQVLFTYLHLAPDYEMTESLIQSGCVAIAYETVSDDRNGLPLLAPMSEVAGRMAVQAGAHCLEMHQGGSGTLLGGVPGVTPGKIVIIGGGVAGANAAIIGTGMCAQVSIIEKSTRRMGELDNQFSRLLTTHYATNDIIEQMVVDADLVIGAVLVPGAAAPKLVSKAMISAMKLGSVVVDIAIDQGGCFETSRPTTHAEPTYVVDDVVHYCVANIPAAVAKTSTHALNNVTLPFALKLADQGFAAAMAEDINLRNGLNIFRGQVTYQAVAEDQERDFVPAEQALAA